MCIRDSCNKYTSNKPTCSDLFEDIKLYNLVMIVVISLLGIAVWSSSQPTYFSSSFSSYYFVPCDISPFATFDSS